MNNKENILLFGNPGVGKTHLAIGLGIKACLANKTVLFISVPNLMIELKEAMNLNQIQKYKRNFEKYDLVILDELGYISFEKEGSELFKDLVLTTAIIDILAHKSHIVDLSGENFRVKETLDWIKNLID